MRILSPYRVRIVCIACEWPGATRHSAATPRTAHTIIRAIPHMYNHLRNQRTTLIHSTASVSHDACKNAVINARKSRRRLTPFSLPPPFFALCKNARKINERMTRARTHPLAAARACVIRRHCCRSACCVCYVCVLLCICVLCQPVWSYLRRFSAAEK